MQASAKDRKSAAARGDATPGCPLCLERLGSYGGPVTLPCGHNGCLQCMAAVQRRKPECPLCRATFPAGLLLTVNGGLRDLIALASTLHTVEEPDGWQTLAAVKQAQPAKGEEGYDPDAQPAQGAAPVALVPPEAPLHCDLEAVIAGGGDLLSLEPPTWVPDSHAGDCTACHQPFKPFARSRHHCRLCGNIFCGACCGARVLLPPKFRSLEPDRACSTCAALLEPLQPFLAGTISRAVQPVVRDVTDSSCGHSWLNPPLATSGLEGDIYKAANIATAFRKLGTLQAERRIPGAVLRGAAGFAILSMAKVGLGWSCGMGSGLVVSRREDDSWSPPSAISAVSAGWGLQVGGELTDLLIVLRSKAAVKAFCGTFAAGLGGGISFAAGPLGRAADAGLTLGRRGATLAYSYSMSRGAFAGVGVQGTVISSREAANLAFYGRPHSARTLLTGDAVAPPTAAAALYQALDELLSWAEMLPQMPGGFLTSQAIQERDATAAASHQFRGCAQDGGLIGPGRRSGRRHGRRGSWRPSRARSLQDAVGEGGWEVHPDSPSAPQMPSLAGSFAAGAGDGDGWETGADLPGAVDIEGDSILAGAGGFGSGIMRLPRQSTRPDISPLPSGRVFGRTASESEDGPCTPAQEAEPDDGALRCLFAE